MAAKDDPRDWFPVGDDTDTKGDKPTKPAVVTPPDAVNPAGPPSQWFAVHPDEPAATPQRGGVVRNLAAGAVEGTGGLIDAATNPVGFLTHQLLQLGTTGYDAVAPTLGLSRLSPGMRSMLLDEGGVTPAGPGGMPAVRPVASIPTPTPGGSTDPGGFGTFLVDKMGDVVGAKPSDVSATTRPEQYARIAGSVLPAAPLLPGVSVRTAVPVLTGAGIATQEAQQVVPDWAKPGVGVLTNLLATGAGLGVGAGLREGANALNRFGSGEAPMFRRPSGVGGPGEPTVRIEPSLGGEPPPAPAAAPPAGPAAPAFVPPGTAAPEAGAPAGGPQPGMGGGGPSPGMGGPQPQAAGAAPTPPAMAGLTPQQAAAHGSMADKQWVFSSQEPGIRDTTQYIPGETISTAQREQTANAAREQKVQRNISPEAQQAEERFLHDQSEFRKNHYQQVAGNDVLQQTAMVRADENIQAGLRKAFNAGGKVDTAPIASAAAAELRGSAGELPPLKSVMRQITDALADKTDPRDVYKVRRLINYMQSKTGKAENKGYGDADVQAALVRVKQVVDRQIEPAAPGFGAAMADYSAAQRAIEAHEYLQSEEPKLYDKNNRMQYSRFHNFMVKMVMQRDPNVAPNPAQSVSQAQFERLQGIHDSLKRAASAEDLARARGSDSAPNLIDVAKEALSGLPGQIAASVVGHAALGPFGAAAAPIVKAGIESIVGKRGQARATAKMRNLLYGTSPPSPNALGPD
jgi:hypothetical protein